MSLALCRTTGWLSKPFKLAQLYRLVARWTEAQPQGDLS